MIYIFTSILNGFDNLRPPACPVDDDVRYICFTNLPNLPRVFPWEYRPAYITGEAARDARIPKILPHLMLPADAEYSIYHDGNFQLRIDPHAVIRDLLDCAQWAAHKHPCRDCVYDEAEIVLRDCPLVNKDAVMRQITQYREADFPAHAGLWANGFLVRRHTPEVAELNELWWTLFKAGSERDQLSFPVARHRLNVPVNTIQADVWGSPYTRHNWHAAWKTRDDNPDFWPQRDRIRARLGELARLTGTDGGIKHQDY